MLPTPPPPRSSRRDATIELALRRFDGERDPVAAQFDPARASWFGDLRRRPAGLLASVLIVAAIGVPATLIGLRGQPEQPEPRARVVEPPAPVGEAAPNADVAPVEAAAASPPAAPVARMTPTTAPPALRREANKLRERAPEIAGRNVTIAAPAAPVPASPPPPPAAQTLDKDDRAVNELSGAAGFDEVVVTGSARRAESAAKSAPGPAEEALNAPRDSAATLLERARARQSNGDWRGALADLDRAHRREPRSPEILGARAAVLRHLGETRRAEADERRLRALAADR